MRPAFPGEDAMACTTRLGSLGGSTGLVAAGATLPLCLTLGSAALAAGLSARDPDTTGAVPAVGNDTLAATPAPGTVTGRQPVPPAAGRGSRSVRRCYGEALNCRLHGAERRHFVASCRLAYGHRLYRGRGAPAPAPAAGASPSGPVSQTASAPPT